MMESDQAAQVSVYKAIRLVSQAIGHVEKAKTGPREMGAFKFRGIDDALEALHGPCNDHGLTILPSVVSIEQTGYMARVLVDYLLVGPSGDTASVRFAGDGIDKQDKAVGKALSSAFKTMVWQTFILPCAGDDMDVENSSGSGPSSSTPGEGGSASGSTTSHGTSKGPRPATEDRPAATPAGGAGVRGGGEPPPPAAPSPPKQQDCQACGKKLTTAGVDRPDLGGLVHKVCSAKHPQDSNPATAIKAAFDGAEEVENGEPF